MLWQKQCWTTTLPSKTLCLKVHGSSWTECSKQRAAQGAHGETGERGCVLVIAGHTSLCIHPDWWGGGGEFRKGNKSPT